MSKKTVQPVSIPYVPESLQDLLFSEVRTWVVLWIRSKIQRLARSNRQFEQALNMAERATNFDIDGDGDIAMPGVPSA